MCYEKKNVNITINLNICMNYKKRGRLIGSHFVSLVVEMLTFHFDEHISILQHLKDDSWPHSQFK